MVIDVGKLYYFVLGILIGIALGGEAMRFLCGG